MRNSGRTDTTNLIAAFRKNCEKLQKKILFKIYRNSPTYLTYITTLNHISVCARVRHVIIKNFFFNRLEATALQCPLNIGKIFYLVKELKLGSRCVGARRRSHIHSTLVSCSRQVVKLQEC